MDRVTILGSASAVPDENHENTHIMVQSGKRVILVDCPGSPIIRLQKMGIGADDLSDLILTHFHPDHVSGFAPLLMGLWLLGRKNSLTVYGNASTIDRAEKMLSLYGWEKWPDFYPVMFVRVADQEFAPLLESPEVRVFASPVEHLIPTIGLRFEFAASEKIFAYSCDTQPSPVVVRLAKDADLLIHEATGSSVGHTPPERAGEIAAEAGAKSLCLIHYPPQLADPESLLSKAGQAYHGPIQVAKDFLSFTFESISAVGVNRAEEL